MEIPTEHWQAFEIALAMGRREAEFMGKDLYAGVCYNESFNFYVGFSPKQICVICGQPFETVKLPSYQLIQEDGKCIVTCGQKPIKHTSHGKHHVSD